MYENAYLINVIKHKMLKKNMWGISLLIEKNRSEVYGIERKLNIHQKNIIFLTPSNIFQRRENAFIPTTTRVQNTDINTLVQLFSFRIFF